MLYILHHKKVYTYFIKKYVIYPFDLILYTTYCCAQRALYILLGCRCI